MPQRQPGSVWARSPPTRWLLTTNTDTHTYNSYTPVASARRHTLKQQQIAQSVPSLRIQVRVSGKAGRLRQQCTYHSQSMASTAPVALAEGTLTRQTAKTAITRSNPYSNSTNATHGYIIFSSHECRLSVERREHAMSRANISEDAYTSLRAVP